MDKTATIEKRLRIVGLLGIAALISYAAMVFFSPLAYPGYDWMSMAVSELTAEGAPSLELAEMLNCLHGPCGLVAVTAVCVACGVCKSKTLRFGIYCFAAMEWISGIGYKLFPWVKDAPNSHPQNIGHLVVTALVVMLSIAALVLIIIGGRKEGIKSLSIWALICLIAMMLGPIGTGLMPKAVFGIFERFSTLAATTFLAVLGWHLFKGRFGENA
ncbi:MAG: DUF998 domain-containing protein [Eubacterium sp.]|nr:DUF998 domain-containing protein [Eubacterium sp.]